MSNDDPFMLDLFGNTAMSSSFGLGGIAFASVGLQSNPPSAPQAPKSQPARPFASKCRQANTATARGENFFLEDSRGLAKDWKQRARDNLAAIRLDCWLVASIEDFDLEPNTARPGPIFIGRVIASPSAPSVTCAADALAVVLNERGHGKEKKEKGCSQTGWSAVARAQSPPSRSQLVVLRRA